MNPILKRGLTVSFILMIGLLAITPLPRPAHSQDPAPQRIESDDPSVTRAGNWTSQAANQASGGSYLYSSGAEADVLTLQFSGSSIEVIFVAGPSLGTLAINVDDIVLRTVITTADQTAYQQSSRIDYLSDEPHTLKVYAQAGGVVAIDAFVVNNTPTPFVETESALAVPRIPCNSNSPIRRVYMAYDGTQANGAGIYFGISDNGRWIAFDSTASNLVAADGDTNSDIFLYDSQTCTIQMLADGNGYSQKVSISGDGNYVAFESTSSDLVANDTNGVQDIFVVNRQTWQKTRVSVDSFGNQGNNISFAPAISYDGRYVTFASTATNLVSGDTNSREDVFVHDRQTGTTTRISVNSDGIEQELSISRAPSPSISANGSLVTFTSVSANLVPDDTNSVDDLFLRDRNTNQTSRLSIGSSGQQSDATVEYGAARYSLQHAMSADGQRVVFASYATSLAPVTSDINVFMRDRATNQTILISQTSDGQPANGDSLGPVISDDGQWVAFESQATNLDNDTNGQIDIYVRNVATGAVRRVSLTESGGETNNYSVLASISGDGRYLVFFSEATNIVSGDTNGYPDLFLVDLQGYFGAANLATTSVSSGHIQLTWIDNAINETEYRIERSPNGLNNWVEIGSAPADSTTYTNVSLTCGTTYHYRVRAYHASVATYSPYSNVATATTNLCPAAPTSLTATTLSQTSIQLAWTDNASDETNFSIERSFNGAGDWSQIGSTVANVAYFTDTVYLACGTTYYYRVRAYRSGDGVFSGYSNVTSANTSPCRPDALALVNPATRSANLIHTLTNPPAGGDYSQFATGLPYGPGGQYVMGDWNGDGLDTIGVYREGAFFFTNDFGTGGTWVGIWFGLGGQPVVGRFDANVNHDCLGVTDSGIWTNGDTYFALYFTCNLTSGPTPPLTFQWLSILLPNSQGFTGTHQFVAGDFNGDGVDSVAVRRGAFIAWTNVPPTTLHSQFNLAQYIGAPGTGDAGKVVAGDWDMNNVDSFGLVYQNGTFYRRNDVEWNTGVYILQTFTPSIGTPFDVASWRPN